MDDHDFVLTPMGFGITHVHTCSINSISKNVELWFWGVPFETVRFWFGLWRSLEICLEDPFGFQTMNKPIYDKSIWIKYLALRIPVFWRHSPLVFGLSHHPKDHHRGTGPWQPLQAVEHADSLRSGPSEPPETRNSRWVSPGKRLPTFGLLCSDSQKEHRRDFKKLRVLVPRPSLQFNVAMDLVGHLVWFSWGTLYLVL